MLTHRPPRLARSVAGHKGGACNYDLPRMSLLGFSVNRGKLPTSLLDQGFASLRNILIIFLGGVVIVGTR